MTTPLPNTSAPSRGLPRGQLALVAVLLLVGVGFLGLAGYRALYPRRVERPPDLARQVEDDLAERGFRPLSAPLEKLINDPAYKPVPTQAPLLLGEPAPDFTLHDVHDKPWRLSEHRGRGPLVLVFYLGYNCTHCVSQLFGLNRDLDRFRELGAAVVAVSPDTPDWTRQQAGKFGGFDFPVLSDPGNKVAQLYGVYHPKPGGDGDLMHGTFVIDDKGKVVWVNTGDEPFVANQTLLIEIARAEGRPGVR